MKEKKSVLGRLEMALQVLAFCLPVASASGAGVVGLTLTDQGMPKAVILKPAGENPVTGFAAEELQKYLKKISGAGLPVQAEDGRAGGAAVILRKAALDPLRDSLQCDSFTVKRDGDRLLLTGNTDRAVLYAVYAFLESLGAAWLEPGEIGEILPRLPTITVRDLDITSKPGFDLRGIVVHNSSGCRVAVDWMSKMRMNLIMHVSPNAQKDCIKRGLLVMEGTSHNFGERLGLGHGWEKNPENYKYMAMVNGKREPLDKDKPDYAEPCLSNAEGEERIIAQSLKFIESYRPGVDILDVRADDRKNNWCECEACSRQTQTDNHLTHLNKLAKAVYERWPEKKVSLIAYLDTISPPKEARPDLSMGNMILWFAPYSRNYRHPIFSATSEKSMGKTSVYYPRNKEGCVQTDDAWYPFLRAWRDAFKGPILVLDYYHWSGNAELRASYFYMRPDVIAADLKTYKKLGISGSIGCEPWPMNLPNNWNNYLKAKLLWDPSQDVADLENNYKKLFYGECAESAEKSLNSVAGIFNAERDDAESVQEVRDAATRFAAETAACRPQSPVVAERLDRLSFWLSYAVLRKEYFRQKKMKSLDGQKKAAAELNAFVELNKTSITRNYSNFKSMQVSPR